MTIKIPDQLLEKTNSLLKKYHIAEKEEPILIAFSGGKDSLLTSLILQELGFKTLALHINMGFANSNSHTKYILELSNKYHIEIEIFSVSNPNMQSVLPEIIRNKINERLTILFNQKQSENDNYTPCTHCYNVKFLALQYLANLYNVEYIALGHHATDAVVSLLKSALMYIDRWDCNHETFKRNNFEHLIFELVNAGHTRTNILSRITELANQNYASTDEPPIKIINYEEKQLKIIRPLFNIFEHEIKQVYSKWNITFASDGCEYSVKSILTPREMIHHKLFRRNFSLELLQYFHKIIKANLKEDGTAKFDARNNRNKLLGTNYKCAFLSEVKL